MKSASVGTFDIVMLQAVEPWHLLGLQAHLIETVATKETRPVLIIHSMRGRVMSIGRYHLYDGTIERAGLTATRRITGGRVIGAGEGWLGLALILPSR
ncbi:MAG TPA: hypothetical protein VKV03_14130, partial [Candidatus Binataceae bacterium]|nr:hypothetical protein [Candidatus Binataceae bacterium]